MSLLDKLKIILPKGKSRAGGVSATGTYNPSGVITLPVYKDHLENISSKRLIQNSKDILSYLFKNDPDMSAAVHAYLTIANTDWVAFAKNAEGQIDPKGQEILQNIIYNLTRTTDYSLKFQLKNGFTTLMEELKYSILLRGAVGAELVFNKQMLPSEIRVVDASTIEWTEKKAGVYKPIQKPKGGGDEISLDIASFFFKFYRRDPSEMYSNSIFVSAINTIVSRMQVINDLYGIMQVTGYPRLTLKVVEEIATKNAPSNVAKDPKALRAWMNTLLAGEASKFAAVNPQQVYAHFDSVEASVINEKNPASALQIAELIDTLNAQNQAALKVVATVIGRGNSGVNTASVEARVFSMSADSLNNPVAELMGEILTLALRMEGFDGYVDFWFSSVEMRPELELEPQKTMRQSRLLTELSLGLITDEEYHLKMHRRLPASGVAQLSGTNFEQGGSMDVSSVSPNSDPLGRSLAPEGSESARSNEVK